MKKPGSRLSRMRREGGRTCGEDGGDQWRRVQFARGHAQVAADVFARLKRRRIDEHIRGNLCCSNWNKKSRIKSNCWDSVWFHTDSRTLEMDLRLGEGFQAGGDESAQGLFLALDGGRSHGGWRIEKARKVFLVMSENSTISLGICYFGKAKEPSARRPLSTILLFARRGQ